MKKDKIICQVRVQESFGILEIPSICTINEFLVCPDTPNFVYYKVFWLSIVTCFVPSCNAAEFLDMWYTTYSIIFFKFCMVLRMQYDFWFSLCMQFSLSSLRM